MMPNPSPVTSVSSAVNPSTDLSMPMSRARGRYSRASSPSALVPQAAISNPTSPPSVASSTLSVSICRMSRRRLPPIAVRMAISRSRVVARASSRLATFAQPISSTNPTAPSSTSSAGRTFPTTRSASGSAFRLPAERRRIRVGIPRREAPGQREELCLELIHRRSRLDAADEIEHPGAAIVHERGVRVVHRDRRPQLHRRGTALHRVPESARHHADDGDRVVVEADGPTDHRPVTAEAPLPQVVGNERDVADAALIVGLGEIATQRRRDPEQREVVEAHDRGLDPLRLVGAGQVDVDRPHGGEIAQGGHLSHQIVVLRLRHRHVAPIRGPPAARGR